LDGNRELKPAQLFIFAQGLSGGKSHAIAPSFQVNWGSSLAGDPLSGEGK